MTSLTSCAISLFLLSPLQMHWPLCYFLNIPGPYIPITLGKPSEVPQIFARLIPHFTPILQSHAILSRRSSLTTLFKIANYLPYSITPYFLHFYSTLYSNFYVVYLFMVFRISFLSLLTEMYRWRFFLFCYLVPKANNFSHFHFSTHFRILYLYKHYFIQCTSQH